MTQSAYLKNNIIVGSPYIRCADRLHVLFASAVLFRQDVSRPDVYSIAILITLSEITNRTSTASLLIFYLMCSSEISVRKHTLRTRVFTYVTLASGVMAASGMLGRLGIFRLT